MNLRDIIDDERKALAHAVQVASLSPCAKSKRGAVVFSRELGLLSAAFNHPPYPFTCDGSDACKAACNRICVHAEDAALLKVGRGLGLEILHVKVVDGRAVPSGPPTCWQCSRTVLECGVEKFWLLHEDGLRAYTAFEFHELTLRHHGLPIITMGGF